MNYILSFLKLLAPTLRLYVGGGDAPKQPTQTTQTVNNVPGFIQPYIESMLGRTQALTSDAQFQPYDESQRFAGVTPLQQQSYQAAAGMQPSEQLTQATGAAGQAIQQAGTAGVNASNLMNAALGYGSGAAGMGAQYAQQATSPGAVGAYMSPYMQNVVDIQKQEAIRDYQKQLPELQAAATRAGAYGGSRQAIMQAEGQRNLMNNLSDIQGRGSQAAYEQALQSMQFGSNLGMQGYQTGLQGVGQGINAAQLGLQGAGTMLQGAGTLGQLGQTQFGQQQAIAELQNAMGTQQQQQQQQLKDFQYQQYREELDFPYSQLAFMSDMTRGLPLYQSTVSQYAAQPSSSAQLLGAGLQAFGYMNRAQGGMIDKPVRRYAVGGRVSPVAFDDMTPDESAAAIASMSDQQLAAYARSVKDAVTLSLIQAEQRKRQNMRAPQGQMPTSTVAQDTAMSGLGAMMPQGAPAAPAPQGAMPAQPAPMAPQGGIAAYQTGGQVDGPRMRPDGRPYTTPGEFFSNMGADVSNAASRVGKWAVDQLPPSSVEAFKRGLTGQPKSGPVAAGSGDVLRVPTISGANPAPAPGTEVAPRPQETDAAREARIFGALDNTTQGQTGRTGQSTTQAPTPTAPQAPTPAEAGSFEEYVKGLNNIVGSTQAESEYTNAMRQGLDDRQARIAAMEKRGQMDALIAAGAAMMNSPTVADALAKGSQAGFSALKQAEQAQAELQAGYEEARDAQAKYEMALKRDDRKNAMSLYAQYNDITQKNLDRAQRLQIAEMQVGATLQVERMRGARSGGDPYIVANRIETNLKSRFGKIDDVLMVVNNFGLDRLKPDQRAQYDAYQAERRALYQQAGIGALLGTDGEGAASTSSSGVRIDPATGDAYRMENGRPVKVGNVNQ